MNPTRRRLLQALCAAPFAARAAAPHGQPNRLLVLVFLYGGNDGFNTWVPYTDETYYRVRPTIAVPRDAVIKATDHHGFHPSLAALAPLWEAKELALVQGIGYRDGTQQHFRDLEVAFTACDGDQFYNDGWVTRALTQRAASRPATATDAVAFDILDIRQSDPMGPFRGGKLGVAQVYYAQDLLAKRNLRECVFEATAPEQRLLARDPGKLAPVALGTSFPTDPFGQAMRAAVELAADDRSIPVIHVALNGLDNDKHTSVDCHKAQLAHHGAALKRLADGLAALRSGLMEIGRWNETLVATYDEFGRSPMENEDKGTHHGLANTHFVLGGRVRGGLYGEAPRVIRMYPIGGPDPAVDTRRLWATVIERWWNLDAKAALGRRFDPIDLLRA